MAAAPDDDRYDLDILKHIEELSEDVKQGDFVVHTIDDGKLERSEERRVGKECW